MTTVKTEKELADAMKRGDDTIEIEGNLAKQIIRIRATGKIAWAIALGTLSIAVYAAITTMGTGGATLPVTGTASLASGFTTIAILGASATSSAIAIAIAFGSVGVLIMLRERYKEVSRTENKLILKRK